MSGFGFTFGWGQVVDAEFFASMVGVGWEQKCEPVEGAAVNPTAETAASEPVVEKAVVEPVVEFASKRRRK